VGSYIENCIPSLDLFPFVIVQFAAHCLSETPKMKLSPVFIVVGALIGLNSATILQNGQVRITDYPNTVIDASAYKFKSYPPDAYELSYKGRWDSKYLSWWSLVSTAPLGFLRLT
jgi:hypothetical protein